MVFAGVREVYAAGKVLLERFLRIPVSASSIYRVTVSTAENLPEDCLYDPLTQESVYAQVDGSMLLTDDKWKERGRPAVKVGSVFGCDAQVGKPI